MFIAIMDSESKEWFSLAETENEAKEAILEKWNKDQVSMVRNGWKNQPETFSSIKKLEECYNIQIIRIEKNECVVF